jgi:polar amino acid transport system substrate-binding protein
MKNTILIALGAVAVTATIAGFAVARDLMTVKKAGTIVIGTEGAYPPMNFFKGKDLVGFEIDLTNAVAKKLGLKTEWKALSFDALLPALGQGKFDMVAASHTITPERAKAVDFLNPEYCTLGVWVTKKGGAKTKAELVGKRIGSDVGSTNLQVLSTFPGIKPENIVSFPKATDALQALIAGRIDAWSVDENPANDAIKANPKANLVIGGITHEQRNAMAVAKGNKELAAALNGALAAVMKDGSYLTFSKKWFGKDIRCTK